ncbi:MAG: TMEM175 family protein [Chitinophagaceae bacterium]
MEGKALPAEKEFITSSRLLSFSAGVFSIAITLLVFNLKLPVLKHNANEQELPGASIKMIPDFISYFLSFFVIGIYWVFHYWMFHYIVKMNNTLILLNMLLLLFISFLPFPSALMGAYGEHPFTAIFYLSTLVCTGLASLLMW